MFAGTTSLTAADGHVIQNGDGLSWRQYQDGATTGGPFFFFTDHTDGLATRDTDGQPIEQDMTMNSCHIRTVDLSAYAGKTIQLIDLFQWTSAQLATMGKDIGAVQQSAVLIGFGANTTQMMTAVGANETAFGTARAGESSPFKAPDINPLQLSGGRANGLLAYRGTTQETCILHMGKKMLVALMMEGKFSREGLQSLDANEDLLTAMARELVEKGGGGDVG